MASRDDDPKLDAALSALSGIDATSADDDERWAKRVASRVSTFAPPSRRELDPLFDAPFPDGHNDRDFDHGAIAADDHHDAVSAADPGDARGWEGSMSESEDRPPNSLAALSGLTRSGPTSASTDVVEGAAKGDDSGLINLKAMTEPPPPVEAEPVKADAAAAGRAPLNKTAAAVPSAISASKIAVASTASANAPPASSTQASAVSAPATASRSAEKKGSGVVIWLGLGGLAAAAAAAFVLVGPMARKADETSAAKPPPPAAAAPVEQKKDDNDKVAAKQEPAPAATASMGAPTEDPHADPAHGPSKAHAPKPGSGAPIATAAPTGNVAAKPTATGGDQKASPPPGGGSLDDVLGIGKDQPVAKKPEGDNLPDKPESMDVRSAINAKVSAASACVKGLEGPSNVSITFGPAGTVSGVVVTSGPAKGTGAESCIKNAFSAAKVPPSKKGASGSATLVP